MLEKIAETVKFIESQCNIQPRVGIILGSGLGGLVNEIDIQCSLPYKDIPHFPISTVEGHSGRLILGHLRGIPIMAMQGRFHYYEGYDMKTVTFPVRVMKALNISQLIVSNAAGGMNPDFKVGDLMVITDHINLFPENPLHGPNNKALGPRFPDMSKAYHHGMVDQMLDIAKSQNILLHKGVYAGVSGPCFETPSEYRYLRIIGADAVGMSTVPEVIVGVHSGMQCFGISVITDMWFENKITSVSHEEVIEAAHSGEKKMTALMLEFIPRISEQKL
jgi:purine-nucleoside phosphorylase